MNIFLRNNLSEKLIENYIYIYHLDQFVIIPVWPETITDSLSSTFAESTPLSRSAPIYSYSKSGPRSMQINLKLHRDMMWDINVSKSNLKLDIGEDYIDKAIKCLQACALPNYKDAAKMVDPPSVAIRFGNEIFIKGIINGAITVSYSGPILDNNKYSVVDIGFTVYETSPYSADEVAKSGSFRGLDKTLERRLYR